MEVHLAEHLSCPGVRHAVHRDGGAKLPGEYRRGEPLAVRLWGAAGAGLGGWCCHQIVDERLMQTQSYLKLDT